MQQSEQNSTEETKKSSFAADVAEVLETVFVSIFVVIMLFAYIIRPVTVEGRSMEATLHNGDRLLMTDLLYTPKRGDIVIVDNSHSYLLDENGDPAESFNLPDAIAGRNPRTVIGYYSPGHYCLLVVDGRQQGYSLGLSMKELAAFMADLGCKAAYNLDGGISAQIAYMGERINHPGKDRNLRDVILLLEPESTPTPAE